MSQQKTPADGEKPSTDKTAFKANPKKTGEAGIGRILLAGIILVCGLVVAFSGGPKAQALASKVTICHRTHSTTNPYRRITVAQASITKNNGHGDEGVSNTHNKGTGVFDPSFSYPPNAKLWNDIIPDETAGGSASITYNFVDAGLAIYNGTSFDGTDYSGLCTRMTAKEFYDSEVAAGIDPADIFLDLDDQDAAVRRQSRAGSFRKAGRTESTVPP